MIMQTQWYSASVFANTEPGQSNCGVWNTTGALQAIMNATDVSVASESISHLQRENARMVFALIAVK